MDFHDKYAKAGDPDAKDKIIISNDAYAVGDMIQKLIDKIEHARLSL